MTQSPSEKVVALQWAPHARHVDARVPPLFWLGGLFWASLHLVFGTERSGKTSAILRLLALALVGRLLPHHDQPLPLLRRVFWMAGDHPSETLAKGLAAGIPPDKIFLTPNGRGEGPLILSEKTHFEGLRAAVRAEECDVLVIESPEVNLKPGQDENSGPAVRFQVMNPLARLALEENLIVIAIKHANKSTMAPASAQYSGSRQWSAAARSLLRVVQTEDGRRFLGALNQSNYAPLNAVEFKISGVPSGDNGEIVGAADFLGVSDQLIGQVDGVGGPVNREDKLDGAAGILRGAFWNRTLVPGEELEEIRIAYGVSDATWRRARKALGLEHLGNSGWRWPSNPCA